ncbi:Os04g0304250, partial [Oryza sativa Japonica Group]
VAADHLPGGVAGHGEEPLAGVDDGAVRARRVGHHERLLQARQRVLELLRHPRQGVVRRAPDAAVHRRLAAPRAAAVAPRRRRRHRTPRLLLVGAAASARRILGDDLQAGGGAAAAGGG